jgi:predicted enzyme related to lactoylglutathione lyase
VASSGLSYRASNTSARELPLRAPGTSSRRSTACGADGNCRTSRATAIDAAAVVSGVAKAFHQRTPDRHGGLELIKFLAPRATTAEPNAPGNTLGIRRIMLAVDDIEDILARLRAHGGELIGEVVQYEDKYRLGYLRGPEGVIVALAQEIGEGGA